MAHHEPGLANGRVPQEPELPPGWRLRPMRFEDAAEVTAVVNDAQRMFGRSDVFSTEELTGLLRMPSVDPARDARVLLDPAGVIVGQVVTMLSWPWTTAQVIANVGDHPERPTLLKVAANEGVRLALARPEAAVQAVVEVNACEEDSVYRGVLDESGFEPLRRSTEMLRSLDALSGAPVQVPDGVTLEALDPGNDALLVELADLEKEAFADHDGDYAMTTEDFVAFIRGMPTLRHDLSVVATEAGAVVGMAVSVADVGDPTGRTGYVATVGVARRARGRGVATAMLSECFRRYREQGWSTARLHVQVGNRTGADRLYRAVGMSPRFVDLTYVKPLR